MTTRPSAELRRLVIARAGGRCEYCRIYQDDAAASHQVDHVLAEKHRGPTEAENLALSCILCNRRKGSDISSIDPESGQIAPLFNPRLQIWEEHFRLDGPRIVGVTPEGRTTVALLELNAPERMIERDTLIAAGRYPSAEQ